MTDTFATTGPTNDTSGANCHAEKVLYSPLTTSWPHHYSQEGKFTIQNLIPPFLEDLLMADPDFSLLHLADAHLDLFGILQ